MPTDYTKSVDVILVLTTLTLFSLFFFFADLLGEGITVYQPEDVALATIWTFIITTLFITYATNIFEGDAGEDASVRRFVTSNLLVTVVFATLRTIIIIGLATVLQITTTTQETLVLAALVFSIAVLTKIDTELNDLRETTSAFTNIYKPQLRQIIVGRSAPTKSDDGSLRDGLTDEVVDTTDYSVGRMSSIIAIASKSIARFAGVIAVVTVLLIFVLSVFTILGIQIPESIYFNSIGAVFIALGVAVGSIFVTYGILLANSDAISLRAMVGTLLFMIGDLLFTVRYQAGLLAGIVYASSLSQTAISTIVVFWFFTVVKLFDSESTEDNVD